MNPIDQKLSEYLEKCRELGLKATHQRTEILRELADSQNHPDAEYIFKRVKKRIPAISLDTVYRTLRTLEEKGIISRVGSVRDRARFDANTDRHHHFVCIKCGKVRDFYSKKLDKFQAPKEVSKLGNVDHVYVELRGICQECKNN